MKITPSYQVKIRELFKYLFLPMSVGLVVLSTLYYESVLDTSDPYLAIFIVGLPGIIVLLAIIFTLFFFFKKKPEITVLYFVILLLLQSVAPRKIDWDYYGTAAFTLLLLTIAYIILVVRSLKKLKENRYLFFLMLTCGFVFSLCFLMFGLTVGVILETDILLLITVGLFIISSIALIFSFPNSDFLEWKKEHKLFFFKAIMVPWLCIVFLSLMSLLIMPYDDFALRKTDRSPAWGMKDYVIELKEGME